MLQQFIRANRGLAVVEFALIAPVLMTVFYGCIEATRYILATQKAAKLAHTVADVTAQSTAVSQAGLTQLFEATNDIMQPFAFASTGRVIISSLYRAPGQPNATVNWRHAGGGNLIATSAFGSVGAVPDLPVAFAFEERENVIATEVFFQYTPLISTQFFDTMVIYRQAFYKPRFGLLTTPPA